MLKEFLSDVTPENSDLHIGGLNNVDLISSDGVEEYLENNKAKDIYFLAGVDKKLGKTRAKDEDIVAKNYVYFDFDVYNEMRKLGAEFSKEELKEHALDSVEKLYGTKYDDWKYLVYSGGGFHLYYICEEMKVDKKKHALGYEIVAKELSKCLELPYDTSCKNIGRIARLPNSYNNKKRFDTPALVEFLEVREVSSNMLQNIISIGEEEIQKQSDEVVNRENTQECAEFKDSRAYEEIIKLPVVREVLDHFPTWELHKDRNFKVANGNLSAAYISDRHENTLMADQSREFTHLNKKSFSTFSFVKHLKNLTSEQTFKYFEDKYFQIRAIAEEERKNWAKKNEEKKDEKKIEFVTWSKMLEDGEGETKDMDDTQVHSYGYRFLDERLGGIFKGELLLVGGITNTGKTTLALKIGEKQALQGKRVVVVALEERLITRARKATLYEVNRIRMKNSLPRIRMIDFLTGRKKPSEDERKVAMKAIKNDNIEYVRCNEKLGIKDLDQIFARKADLYIFDHLHYFGLHQKDKSKADAVEESMQYIKDMTVKNDTRSLLIAHFQKIDESKKPTMTNFKDSISIAQTADTIIMLWRDKNKDSDLQSQYTTSFIIPKNRVDEPAMTLEAEFDISTNDYIERGTQSYHGTENSELIQNATKIFKPNF